jgi:hypothetical protein
LILKSRPVLTDDSAVADDVGIRAPAGGQIIGHTQPIWVGTMLIVLIALLSFLVLHLRLYVAASWR